jgi:vesicle coat complex subunit
MRATFYILLSVRNCLFFNPPKKINNTREQTIWMFFSEEYNEENVARLLKKIDDFGSFDTSSALAY